MEILTKSWKLIMNVVLELKRQLSEASPTSNKSSMLPLFKIINNSEQDTYFQSSNVMFNIKSLGMDNFSTFHEEKYFEKACPQWNHNMNTMMVNLVDTLLIEEHYEKNEETRKPFTHEDNASDGHSINMFNIIYNADRQSVYQSIMSEAPPKQSTDFTTSREKDLFLSRRLRISCCT